MKNTIGIIGYNGEIGRILTKILLDKGYQVKGGQRNKSENFSDYSNFEYKKLDIYDNNQLKDFCFSCDAVVNCVGPAYTIKNKIKKAVSNSSILYIDFSEYLYSEYKKDKNRFLNGVSIIAAGFIPGLLGVILDTVINCDFDKVSEINGVQITSQVCSLNAFIDVLLSSSINGLTDVRISNNKVEKFKINEFEEFRIPQYEKIIYLKPYISDEILDICESKKIPELTWYNATIHKENLNLLLKLYSLLFHDKKDINYEVVKEYYGYFLKQEDICNTEPVIYIDIKGEKNQEKVRKRYIINIENGYQTCGIFAAKLVEICCSKKIENGLYWAKDFFTYNGISEINTDFNSEVVYGYDIEYDSESMTDTQYESNFI